MDLQKAILNHYNLWEMEKLHCSNAMYRYKHERLEKCRLENKLNGSVPSSSSSAAHLRHQQLLTCNFSTSEAVVGSFHQGLATSPRLKQGMSQNESLWGKKSQVGYSCGIHARKNQGQQKHSHGRPEPICGSSTILRRKQNWCKEKQMKGNHHPSNWFVGLGNSFQTFKV